MSNDEHDTTSGQRPAVATRLDRGVGRPAPERAEVECKHSRKMEKHFTYGYRWHCPDCKAGGEDWWD